MRIDLLLVFLFQAKDDLHGDNPLLRTFDLVRRRNRDCERCETNGKTGAGTPTLSSILVYVCRHWLPVNGIGRDALLIGAYCRNNAQGSRVDLLTAIADDADDHFLPALLAPGLTAITLAQISNVLHNAVHRPCEEAVILVIHGHDDEQLSSTGRVIEHLAKSETIVLEVVGVTRCRGITHVGEFALFLVYAKVEQLSRDLCIMHKVSMKEPAQESEGREGQSRLIRGWHRQETHSTRFRVLCLRGTRCGMRP